MNGASATVDTHIGGMTQHRDFTLPDKRSSIPNGMTEQIRASVCPVLCCSPGPPPHPTPARASLGLEEGQLIAKKQHELQVLRGPVCPGRVGALYKLSHGMPAMCSQVGATIPIWQKNMKPRGVGELA